MISITCRAGLAAALALSLNGLGAQAAENSDGFHNPDQARESLACSIDLTQGAIKKLREAMDPSLAQAAVPAAAPAADKKK